MNDQPLTTIVNESPKPKRRWFQFNLRTLLMMMLVFGCGLGWVAYERRKNAKYQGHVDAIRKIGGGVKIDRRNPERPKWLQAILGDESYQHVVRVNLEHTVDAKNGMKNIEDFKELQELWTSRNVTDADLVHLKGLTQLKELKLYGTKVTNAGLVHLKHLTQIEWLHLDNTQVTDVGLKHLKALKQLRRLGLTGTQITAAGLEHLSTLKQLRQLTVDGKRITSVEIANFEASNPNCEVN